MRRLAGVLLVLCCASPVFAARVSGTGGGSGTVTVTEADGAPSVAAGTIKFSNGSVTDNGDGSASVTVTGGGAPTGATYIMQTADAGTSAEQALGALATGCLGSTTTTGVVASRTLTGTANQITVTNGDCSGNPTLSIPTNPTLPGTVSATAFTATGASSGIVDINGVTSGKLRLTTADATAQTITISGAAQTTGASTLTIPDMAGVSDTFLFAAKSSTLTNKSYDTEGTGNVFTYKKYKYIPMAGCNNATAGSVWDLPTSNPAVAACRTGTNTQKGTLDFADGSSLSAQYHDMLTEDWTGVIDAVVVWESSTTTGDVVWQLALACAGDGESDDPAFTDDVFTADTAKGTGNQYNMTAVNTITTTGTCAASKIMHARLKRDSAHASDTMAGTARGVGLYLKLREAQ